jgi:ribonuclease P protein component
VSLPKPHRLRRRQDFQQVYQYGKRHQQVHLTLRSLQHLLKSALRQLLPQIASGWSVVIGVRPSAQGCEYAEILRELEQLLASAGIIDGH